MPSDAFSRCRLTVDPLFLGVLALAVGLGRVTEAILAVVCLAAHECAHFVVAGAVGFRPATLHLMPFGGIMTLGENAHLRPPAELALAAAGPAANLALAALAAWLHPLPFIASAPAVFAFWLNVGMAAANLLPAEPLDGGRVLRAAAAEWFGEKAAGRLCGRLTTAVILGLTGAALLLTLVSARHLGWAVNLLALAVFLQLGRLRAAAPTGQLFYQRLQAKRRHLADGRILVGRHLVMSEETGLVRVLDHLKSGSYSFVVVCGRDLSPKGLAGEADAVRVLEETGPAATGADLLKKGGRPA